MKTIEEKADVLIEAMPYIRDFRGEIVVIKFGGSAMENKDCFANILADVAFLECVGLKPVIVHGGGSAISRKMKESGLTPTFVKGLRITDAESIKVVKKTLTEEVNPAIVKKLEELGAHATGLEGSRVLTAEKHMPIDTTTLESHDIGYVGKVTKVDSFPIKSCLNSCSVPVITPIGKNAQGQFFNINADDAAAAIAAALRARKLVFLSDVPGLLKDQNNPESIISHLRCADVDALIENGVINGGMMPKIRGALDAMKSGVKKIHIVDGRMQRSLLLEIFTKTGIGTEIVHDE